MKENRTVSRTLDLLEIFAEDKNKKLSLAEITKLMGIPKTSVFDILSTLVERGYVELASEDSKLYKLGYRSFVIGRAYIGGTDICSVSKSFIKELMEKTNKTVFLGILKKQYVVYLDKCEPKSPFYLKASIGSLQPAYSTGLGKAMLATLQDDDIYTLMGEEPYEKYTEKTIIRYEELIKELKTIQKRGYSIDDGENELETLCYAAPIRDYSGKMVAAVSISSLKLNYTEEEKETYPGYVINTAMNISRNLGFQGNSLY